MNLNELNNAFNFVGHRCLWLIEGDINASILFEHFPYKYVNDISHLEAYDLFDEDINQGYKCILSKQMEKEYINFFKNSDRNNWNKNLLIKADVKYMAQAKQFKQDCIISFENITKSELLVLFQFFIKFKNIVLNEVEWDFIKKNITSLQELNLCILLKESNIELKEWAYFISAQDSSWHYKFKNNILLQDGIINDNVIPVLKYMISASSNNLVPSGIMNFLCAAIKDGQKIYQLNNLWKQLC